MHWRPARFFVSANRLSLRLKVFHTLKSRTAGLDSGHVPVFLLLFAVMISLPIRAQRTATAANATDHLQTGLVPGKSDPELDGIASEIQRGLYGRAESDTRAFLQRNPESSSGHNLLGYVLYRENKPRDSLAEYSTGARYRKPDVNDLAVVAMDYILLADYADADKWLTKATEWEPGNALYWYYLGRTKYSENRFQEAITAFQQTLKLHPQDLHAEYNLGLAFAGLGRTSDAMASYEKAIEWEGNDGNGDPQPYLDLGLLLAQQGKTEQAAPYLMKAAELDPSNPKAHEALGNNLEEQGRLDKAESEYKAAIALAPSIPALHFQLGRIYQKEKLTELAREEFAKCAALDNTHSTDSVETPNIPGVH